MRSQKVLTKSKDLRVKMPDQIFKTLYKTIMVIYQAMVKVYLSKTMMMSISIVMNYQMNYSAQQKPFHLMMMTCFKVLAILETQHYQIPKKPASKMKISTKRVITNLLRVEPRVLFHKDLQGTGPKVECHRDLQELRENFQNLKKRTKINPNKELCGTLSIVL